jgi:hypothetical protein
VCPRCAAAGYTVMATTLPNHGQSFDLALQCARLIPDHRCPQSSTHQPRLSLQSTRPALTAKAAPRPRSISPRPPSIIPFRPIHRREMVVCPCCRRGATRPTHGGQKPRAARCAAVGAAASSRTSSTHRVQNANSARRRPLPRPTSRHLPVVKTKSSSGIRERRLARHG